MNWAAFIEALRKEVRAAEDRAHRNVVSPSPAAEVLMALHRAFSAALAA